MTVGAKILTRRDAASINRINFCLRSWKTFDSGTPQPTVHTTIPSRTAAIARLNQYLLYTQKNLDQSIHRVLQLHQARFCETARMSRNAQTLLRSAQTDYYHVHPLRDYMLDGYTPVPTLLYRWFQAALLRVTRPDRNHQLPGEPVCRSCRRNWRHAGGHRQ